MLGQIVSVVSLAGAPSCDKEDETDITSMKIARRAYRIAAPVPSGKKSTKYIVYGSDRKRLLSPCRHLYTPNDGRSLFRHVEWRAMKTFRPNLEPLEDRVALDAKALPMIGVESVGVIPWNNTRPFVEVRPNLASADFDGDGVSDLLVANERELQIFLDNGHTIDLADLEIPQASPVDRLATADINGDGVEDIVSFDRDGLHVRINESEGQSLSFADPVSTSLPSEELRFALRKVEFADLNGDGNADMVRGIHGKGLIVNLGRGNGTFELGIQYENESSVALVDVDRDGFIDLAYVVSSGFNETGLEVLTENFLMNDGTGFFEFSSQFVRTGPLSKSLSILPPNFDVNDDGVNDRLGFVDGGGGEFLFWVSQSDNGQVIWEEPTIYSGPLIGVSPGFNSIDYADVNGDGELDVIHSNEADWHSGVDNTAGGTMVMLNLGGGQFADPLRISSTVGDIAATDGLIAISAEGSIEFLRTTKSPFDGATILESRVGQPSFGEGGFAERYLPVVTEFIDANNDGKLDIVRERESLWLNERGRIFQPDQEIFTGIEADALTERLDAQKPLELNQNALPESKPAFNVWRKMEAADFNGDGIQDAVILDSSKSIHDLNFDGTANEWTAELSVWLGDAAGAYTESNVVENAGYALEVVDADEDGFADLLALTRQSGQSPAELIVFSGSSEGLIEQSRQAIPAEVNFVQSADLNGDGDRDFVLGSLDGKVTLLTFSETGYQTEVHAIAQFVDEAFVGDMDLDGKDDVLVAEFGTVFRPAGQCFFCSEFPRFDSLEVKLTTLSATDAGNFEASVQSRVSAFNANEMLIEDMDGDQDLDIVLAGNALTIVWNAASESLPLLTLDDVHRQCVAIRSEEADSKFDQNSDGVVDLDDLETLIRVEGNTMFGDTNLDGAVDFTDFLQLSTNFGAADAIWETGDFNCDGEVTFADFLILSSNFGFVSTPTS